MTNPIIKKFIKENPQKRYCTLIPPQSFDLGLKPHELYTYHQYFYPGKPISLKFWKIFEKKGLAEKFSYSENEIISLIKSKKPQKIINSYLICEWCKCSTFSLHKHHYPIKKRDRGRIIVNICPNCHYEFHHLEKVKYRIKPEYEILVVT